MATPNLPLPTPSEPGSDNIDEILAQTGGGGDPAETGLEDGGDPASAAPALTPELAAAVQEAGVDIAEVIQAGLLQLTPEGREGLQYDIQQAAEAEYQQRFGRDFLGTIQKFTADPSSQGFQRLAAMVDAARGQAPPIPGAEDSPYGQDPVVQNLARQVQQLSQQLRQLQPVAEQAHQATAAEGFKRAVSAEFGAFFQRVPAANEDREDLGRELIERVQENEARYRRPGEVMKLLTSMWQRNQRLRKSGGEQRLGPRPLPARGGGMPGRSVRRGEFPQSEDKAVELVLAEMDALSGHGR